MKRLFLYAIFTIGVMLNIYLEKINIINSIQNGVISLSLIVSFYFINKKFVID